MKKFLSYIKTFFGMTPYERKTVVIVFLLSAWYRLRVVFLPMKHLEKRMGVSGRETPFEEIADDRISTVCRIVPKVCRHTPWESKCLVQALIAKHLLSKAQLPATLYMGVKKNEDGALTAHAWLRCGTKFVTGGLGASEYAITGFWGDVTAGY